MMMGDSLNSIGLLLEHTTSLQSLTLSGKGVGGVSSFLAHNRSLTILDLGNTYNHINN